MFDSKEDKSVYKPHLQTGQPFRLSGSGRKHIYVDTVTNKCSKAGPQPSFLAGSANLAA